MVATTITHQQSSPPIFPNKNIPQIARDSNFQLKSHVT